MSEQQQEFDGQDALPYWSVLEAVERCAAVARTASWGNRALVGVAPATFREHMARELAVTPDTVETWLARQNIHLLWVAPTEAGATTNETGSSVDQLPRLGDVMLWPAADDT